MGGEVEGDAVGRRERIFNIIDTKKDRFPNGYYSCREGDLFSMVHLMGQLEDVFQSPTDHERSAALLQSEKECSQQTTARV